MAKYWFWSDSVISKEGVIVVIFYFVTILVADFIDKFFHLQGVLSLFFAAVATIGLTYVVYTKNLAYKPRIKRNK